MRDTQAKLEEAEVAVVGISPDTPVVQAKFAQKQNIKFPLLSDADHTVAKAYGVWGQKSMYGKKFEGIIRSSFLIDEKSKIMKAWHKISPADTVPKALEALAFM